MGKILRERNVSMGGITSRMQFHILFLALSILGFSHFSFGKGPQDHRLRSSSRSINASAKEKCRSDQWRGVKSVDGKVLRTVDGDTAHIEIDGRDFSVRFLGIDTPETNFNGKSQGFWGEAASERLKELLPEGKWVTVQFDDEKCDSNGRMLAHILLGDININRQMVSEGLAVNYCIEPNHRYCVQYGKEVRQSIKEHKGMFSDKQTQTPYIWRRRVSKRPFTKFVGDLKTRKVYSPGSFKKVPIHRRVFFFEKEDIQPPYEYVGS